MPYNLTQQDIMNLQAKGYTPQQIQQAMSELSTEQDYGEYPEEVPSTAFPFSPSDNLIKWQLELNDLLQRAEHILREDVPVATAEGLKWNPNPKPEDRIFTEYGVQEIMRILSMYINRNTILSDYEPDEIQEKVYDFGKEVSDLIFMKYEKFFNSPSFEKVFKSLFDLELEDYTKEYINLNFPEYFKEFFDGEAKLVNGKWYKVNDSGLSELPKDIVRMVSLQVKRDFHHSSNKIAVRVRNEIESRMLEKRKNYPMIMREIIDIVHSSYKRALWGGERDSLRTARSITQQEQVGSVYQSTPQQYTARKWYDPRKWVGKKQEEGV